MSKLLAMVFDGPHKADEVRTMLYRMKDDCQINIEETAVIATYSDGSTRFSQDTNFGGADEKIAQRVALLTATIAGVTPSLVLDVFDAEWVEQLLSQAHARKFIDDMQRELKPRTSALLLFTTTEQRIKLTQPLRRWYPRLLEVDLPEPEAWEFDTTLAWNANEFPERRVAQGGVN